MRNGQFAVGVGGVSSKICNSRATKQQCVPPPNKINDASIAETTFHIYRR